MLWCSMTGSKFTLDRGCTITEQHPSRLKENLEASKLTWEPESSSQHKVTNNTCTCNEKISHPSHGCSLGQGKVKSQIRVQELGCRYYHPITPIWTTSKVMDLMVRSTEHPLHSFHGHSIPSSYGIHSWPGYEAFYLMEQPTHQENPETKQSIQIQYAKK